MAYFTSLCTRSVHADAGLLISFQQPLCSTRSASRHMLEQRVTYRKWDWDWRVSFVNCMTLEELWNNTVWSSLRVTKCTAVRVWGVPFCQWHPTWAAWWNSNHWHTDTPLFNGLQKKLKSAKGSINGKPCSQISERKKVHAPEQWSMRREIEG